MRRRSKRFLLIGGVFLLGVVSALWLVGRAREPRQVPASCTDGACDGEAARTNRELVTEFARRGVPLSSLYQAHSASPRMIEALGLRAQDVVADIGCGTGAFEVLLLERGTPFQKLYAVDIDKQALDFLAFVLEEGKLPGRERLETVLSTVDDTRLPAGALDVIFLLNTPFFVPTWDEIHRGSLTTGPHLCLQSIRRALKPTGRFHVFDWNQDEEPADRAARMRWALESVGFHVEAVATIQLGDYPHQHFILTPNGHAPGADKAAIP